MISLADIKEACAAAWGVTVDDVESRRRDGRAMRARHCYYLLARRLTDKSWGQISRSVGGRDHSTAFEGAARADRLLVEHEFHAHYTHTKARLEATSGCGWFTSLKRYPGPSPMEGKA